MGFDQPGRDLQVRLDKTAVDPGGHTARRITQAGVLIQFLPVVVLDPVVRRDLLTDKLDEFITLIGAMQPGRDQDQDLLSRNPR